MSNLTTEQRAELQNAVLLALNVPHGRLVVTSGQWSWLGEVQNHLGSSWRASPDDLHEAVWSLIAQKLAYISSSQENPAQWTFRLSGAGSIAANGEAFNPDNSGAYVKRVTNLVPEATHEVVLYLTEAETSYVNSCFLSCVVMLGVASESAFLDLARSFAKWVGGNEGQNFSGLIEQRGTNFVRKFDEFRKRLEPRKSRLPAVVGSGLGVTLIGVGDYLRLHRNEAGHPTGVAMDRATVFTLLQYFPVLLRKIYDLKYQFDNP